LVVPDGIRDDFVPHCVHLQRNSNEPRTLGLHRTYEPLDSCYTSTLPHGTEPRTNASSVTPTLERIAPELAAFVGDDIPGSITHVTDRLVYTALNIAGRGVVVEKGEANHGA
jgi:hypothetical protein